MLSIRMQRLGRKGYPTYRMVVQDKKQAPNSGKVIAYLGSYNPHTKEKSIDAAQAEKFLSNGAHPSPRVAALLIAEGVTMPKWVKLRSQTDRTVRNPEKLRKNQPKEEAPAEEPAAAEVEATEEVAVEA
jgi:small subunit ribosomal protein S16